MSNTTHSVSLENDAQKITTSRKREEREARENSLPLADVIATSDVNSKNDQKEISKKDVIQHASPESTSQNTLNNYTAVQESGSEKDMESVYGLQNNSPKVKSNEISGLNNFLEEEPSSYQNEVKKSNVPTLNSNIKDIENRAKKSQLDLKSKSSRVLKANSESKLTQNNSTQSDPKKKKLEAATYTDFLRITDSPNSAQKHNSVEHEADDAEMNDALAKYTSSEKALKFQESKELDKENALSGSERNEERMEDSTEDDSMKSDDESKNVSENASENDDKLMGDKGKMSKDASEMESEDAISERNSGKQSPVKANSDTSDDIPSNVDDPVIELDDGAKTSTKKFRKHSKETSQSETETMDNSSEEDHSDMSDSSSGEDKANETDNEDDNSESEDDSMESGKDLDEGKVGSPQDEETVQENSEEETLGSPGESKSTGENLKEHSLDSAEDSSRSQEDEQGSTEEPTESTSGLKEKSDRAEKETKKIEHSDSEINIDLGNNVESIVDDNSENKAQQSDSLLSEENMDRKTGDKTKDLEEKSDSKDHSPGKDGPEINSDAGLTSSTSEESSAVSIDGKNNVKGFDSSDSKTIDNSKTNLNNLNQADLEMDDSSTGSRVDAEPGPSSHENRKAYEENSNVKTNSDHDSSSGKQKHEADVSSESNSKESINNNKPPSVDDEKEIHLEENRSEKTEDNSKQVTNNEIDSKEATRKEDSANYLNSNEVNSDNDSEETKDTRENNLGVGSVVSDNENTTPSKDNTDNEVVIEATSKTGQSTVSPTMNNDDSTETKTENEKKIAQEENKEVKPKESGKIIETSYRVNDDDTSEDDGSRDQGKIGSLYLQRGWGGGPHLLWRWSLFIKGGGVFTSKDTSGI